MHEGKRTNRGNILRFAKRLDPLTLSLLDIEFEIEKGKAIQRDFTSKSKWLRQEHLRQCLLEVRDEGDKEKEKEIKVIMNKELSRYTWRSIKTATKGPRSSSVTHVTTIHDGTQVIHRSKEDIEAAIRSEIGSRFTVAHDAPIMQNSTRRTPPLSKR